MAKKKADEEAAKNRKLIEAKEKQEEDRKLNGDFTKDELWTLNLPRGWLNGYL